jgi:predicted metal-dependent hydrolase
MASVMHSHETAFQHGIELFNSGKFFEAHEVLEDVWRESKGDRKQFLQGLVQLAVGFHHHSTGNITGAESVLMRGIGNLAGYPDEYEGINVRMLHDGVQAWISALKKRNPSPPFPHI